ncbi:hypothetical protein TIFTF001_004387 [Ficus carica]|uniref:Uncharacterized protein n=1 Tax=Ficus carica TaxID=3494 RepID=A0AA88CT48_FICCA|nr:hypothetical protein TIFTF001_004387 [Ficus carica]
MLAKLLDGPNRVFRTGRTDTGQAGPEKNVSKIARWTKRGFPDRPDRYRSGRSEKNVSKIARWSGRSNPDRVFLVPVRPVPSGPCFLDRLDRIRSCRSDPDRVFWPGLTRPGQDGPIRTVFSGPA